MKDEKYKITNKIDHIWSVLCSQSTLDQETNNLSLFNLVEQLNVDVGEETYKKHSSEKNKGFIIRTSLILVSRFKKINTKDALILDLLIEFLDPDNKSLFKMESSMHFKKELKNLRIRNIIDKLPINKSGDYIFIVKIREVGESAFTEVAKIPLEVNISLSKS